MEIRKIRTYFKALVSKNATWWLEEPLRLTVNFYKKQCLPVIRWTIKYLSKQAISITYTLEKRFFCSWYFWRFVCPFSSEIVKIVVQFGLLWISFTFLENRRPSKYCLWEADLVFYRYIFSLMRQSVYLFRKVAV